MTKILWLIAFMNTINLICAQEVKLSTYSSPTEFNQKILNNENLQAFWIPIYKEEITETEQRIIFLDRMSNVINTIDLTGSRDHVRARIDEKYQEVHIIRREFIYNRYSDVIGVKSIRTEMYKSNGELKFVFDNPSLILKRLNENYYLTHAEDIENSENFSFLVNNSGQIIKKLEGLNNFEVHTSPNNSYILLTNSDNTLWRISKNGEVLHKVKRPQNSYHLGRHTISDTGILCYANKNELFLLDSTLSLIQKHTLEAPTLSYTSVISNDGIKILIINSGAERDSLNRGRSCTISLIETMTSKIIWRTHYPLTTEPSRRVTHYGFFNDYTYIKFLRGPLFLFDDSGKKILETKPSQRDRLNLKFANLKSALLSYDYKINEITLIQSK